VPEARRCPQCAQTKQLRYFPYVYAAGDPPGVCRRCLWAVRAPVKVPVKEREQPPAAVVPAAAVRERVVAFLPSGPPPEPLPPVTRVSRWAVLLHACGAPSDDIAELVERQGGVCACCGRGFGEQGPRIHRDRARPEPSSYCAILCHRCLSALGLLGNDVRLLARAFRYLRSVAVASDVPGDEPVSWRVLTPGPPALAVVGPWWEQVRRRIARWRVAGGS
jgi:hypothetical protein